MLVAFNALFLQEPRTGTGRYVYNLLAALGRVDGMNEYLVLSPHKVAAQPDTPSSFTWQTEPVGRLGAGRENIEKLVWEQRTFPRAAKRVGARVAHVPHFAPPLRPLGVPTIVTIHDVISLRLAEYHASPTSQAYNRLVAAAARRAIAIIAVSDFTKRDIMEVLQIAPERIHVIREAPDARFRPTSDAEQWVIRQRYGLGQRFILNVGGMDARKNIATLVGAFAALYHTLGDPTLQLFIAGDPARLGTSPVFPDWRPIAQDLGVLEQIVCMPIAEADLPAVYSAASCFVFTSLYEGFGLTPLEAMACGAPVVCSDRASLPEVVGVAGLLVNPEDPAAIAAKIQHVLDSPPTAAQLRERGLTHARRFSWPSVAAATSALYAEVAGAKRE